MRACRFEPVERVPVWIMRQAGRYLPEYQAVRAKHSFLEICKTPEVAAEVSLQPFRMIGVDAIIVFSDILIVAEAMGLPLDVPDSGPVLSNPVRDVAAVRACAISIPSARRNLSATPFARSARKSGPDVPVIGFAAAPWTLACYMIEGQTRGDISRAKQMLRERAGDGARAARTDCARDRAYLKSQIAAGAAVVQLFDTWAGELSASEYDAFELPATQMVFELLGARSVPKILFAQRLGASASESLQSRTGADVIERGLAHGFGGGARGLLGRSESRCKEMWTRTFCLGLKQDVREAARDAVEKTGGLGHILNLGPRNPARDSRGERQSVRGGGTSCARRCTRTSGKAD